MDGLVKLEYNHNLNLLEKDRSPEAYDHVANNGLAAIKFALDRLVTCVASESGDLHLKCSFYEEVYRYPDLSGPDYYPRYKIFKSGLILVAFPKYERGIYNLNRGETTTILNKTDPIILCLNIPVKLSKRLIGTCKSKDYIWIPPSSGSGIVPNSIVGAFIFKKPLDEEIKKHKWIKRIADLR